MEILIIPTDQLLAIDGVQVRLWEGVTEDGTPCKVFVHAIAVANDPRAEPFAARLLARPQPQHIDPLP